jgi:hypothetical protein
MSVGTDAPRPAPSNSIISVDSRERIYTKWRGSGSSAAPTTSTPRSRRTGRPSCSERELRRRNQLVPGRLLSRDCSDLVATSSLPAE